MVLLFSVTCTTGTLDALNRIMFGGVIPGGAMRRIELFCAEICAMAPPMRPGSRPA